MARGLLRIGHVLRMPVVWGTFILLWALMIVLWILAIVLISGRLENLTLPVSTAATRAIQCLGALAVGWLWPVHRRATIAEQAGAVAVVMFLAFADQWIALALGPIPGWVLPSSWDRAIGQTPFRLTIAFVFAGLGRFGRRLLRAQQVGVVVAAMEAELQEARARFYRAKLQPAFIVHCLDEIKKLMLVDPVQADQFLVEVSEFLRLTIRRSTSDHVELAGEFEYLTRCLELGNVPGYAEDALKLQADSALYPASVPTGILVALAEQLDVQLLVGANRSPITVVATEDAGHLKLSMTIPADDVASGVPKTAWITLPLSHA